MPMHKVAIIGGGPAGSAAAIQLARAGEQVCLLERKLEAHHKVCGEFISWEAAHYLKELGIDLPALGAQAIRRLRLYDGEAALECTLPFPAWSLSRRRLDAVLLKQAGRAGVTVRPGEAVRGLSSFKRDWQLNTAKQSEASTQQPALHANTVFLASGKHDLRNWRREQPRQDLVGLKMHLRLNAAQQEQLRDSVEVHLFDEGYAGLEPVEDGKANLCFLISKDIFKAFGKNWPGLLSWLRESSSHMKARLAGCVSLWPRPLAVYGTPYGYLHRPISSQPSLFRLGDQMAVIPSFAGDGIAIALHSGFLAAEVHVSGGDSMLYHRRARKDFQRPVRNAQILAGVLSNVQGKRLAFLLSRHWPGLTRAVICQIRLDKIQKRSVC